MEASAACSLSLLAGVTFEDHELPSKVLNPSEQEISDVLCKLELSKVSSGNPHRPWQNLHDGRCVKYDSVNYQAKVAEARVMDIIRLHTSIPVPQVYFVFERDRITYTVMEFIEGTPLADSYRVTSPEELQGIATQIKDYIRQLRALTVTPSFSLGAYDGGPFNNVYFRPLPWDPIPDTIFPSHPFDSIQAFNVYWLARAKLDISLDESESSSIVLTHGDLTGRNILINSGKIVAILDWETVGWYPVFWETMIMWRDGRWSKKWHTALESAFTAKTDIDDRYIQLLDSTFKEPARY